MNFTSEFYEFKKEFENHYSTYPVDVSDIEAELNKKYAENPEATLFQRKQWIFEAAAEKCQIKIFKHCPFYFEVVTGNPRNCAGGFPPPEGIGGWAMRTDKSGLQKDFQNWITPLRQQSIILSVMYVDAAHNAMGIEKFLKYGCKGIISQAEERLQNETNKNKIDFLKSVIGCNKAIIKLGERFSAEAEKLLQTETDNAVIENLKRIAESAKRCPANPPANFYEALNTVWFLRELGNSIECIGSAILGHLDRILYTYYKNDIEKNIITKDEARDLIERFCAMTDSKWNLDEASHGTNTTINIGGCDENGNPVFNDITKFIVESYTKYGLLNPKIEARFSESSPEEYYDLITTLASKSCNVLSIFNDNVIIPAQVKMGKKLEHARLYVSGGCQEPLLSGTEMNSRGICFLNISKFLLMMLFPEQYTEFWNSEHIAIQSVTNCSDFDQFYNRVINNIRKIISTFAFRYNSFEARWKDYNPCPFMSSTMEGCIEKAVDISAGGTIYNQSAFAVTGTGTFIDSLLSIRETIFNSHKFTMEQMKKMLECNFEGFQIEQTYILNRVEKYGTDSESVNTFARKVFDDLAESTGGFPNARGGFYEPSLWSFFSYEHLRKNTGATPDGRKAFEPLTRGINPSDDTETNIMAVIHTLENIDMTKFPGSAVNYIEMPVTLAKNNPDMLKHIIRYFISCGGNVFDFNVLDPEVLKDAMENPEKHRNLIVRVCGFSARFVTLSKDTQLEVLNRALRSAS